MAKEVPLHRTTSGRRGSVEQVGKALRFGSDGLTPPTIKQAQKVDEKDENDKQDKQFI